MGRPHKKDVIDNVMKMKSNGLSQSEISKAIGISSSAVAGIIARNRTDDPDKKLSSIQGKPVEINGIIYPSHSEASRKTRLHLRSKPKPLSSRNWSEIKYAPKCGMEILAFSDGEYFVASWSIQLQCWRGHYQERECKYMKVNPTHWMPLPSPPSS